MRLSALFAAVLLCACAAGARQAPPLDASYPEGPLWRGGALYFAEMGADRVTRYEAGERRAFFSQTGCGPTAIAPYGEGFLVLCHLGARVVAVDADGRAHRRWRRDADGAALVNPNDASADNRGGVYFSDPGPFALPPEAQGRVMYLSADGALSVVAGPLHYPNGVHVAGDALYVSEHLARRVLRFPIEASGRLGAPSVFADLDALDLPPRYASSYALAGPDGLEVGPDGVLYVAIYGEGRVLRFGADGAFLGTIETEARYVTNIAFSETGAMAIVGAHDNLHPPYPGVVLIEP